MSTLFFNLELDHRFPYGGTRQHSISPDQIESFHHNTSGSLFVHLAGNRFPKYVTPRSKILEDFKHHQLVLIPLNTIKGQIKVNPLAVAQISSKVDGNDELSGPTTLEYRSGRKISVLEPFRTVQSNLRQTHLDAV